ncbi:unnamed protein product, partial [Symbiodinium natans]
EPDSAMACCQHLHDPWLCGRRRCAQLSRPLSRPIIASVFLASSLFLAGCGE